MIDLSDFWKAAAGTFAAGWIGVLSWLGIRQINRIDDIEKVKANKDSTNARFDDLQHTLDKHVADDKAIHEKILDELKDMNVYVSQTAITVAGLAADIKHLLGAQK